MGDEKKRSPVEGFKESSNLLRGTIAAELRDATDHFSAGNVQLLKHHGMYQQDDRDVRLANRAEGRSGKQFMFLLRTRIPGGMLTARQFLSELELCDEYGNGTLRITSRQALQLHGILKTDLCATIQRIHAVHLTTFGACGDVNRNVMCCPAPYATPVHQQMQSLARRFSEHFAPRTRAYHDIWLCDMQSGDKRLVDGGAAEDEPLYGRTYLPRKFKIGIALPHDNCIDVQTHDLGLLAIVRQERIIGYNVLVGGGMGVTPSNKRTFPALAGKLAFAAPDEVVALVEAVIKVQRDHGDRADRKVARLKYLIHDWGMEAFRAKVQAYHGGVLADPLADDVHGVVDHLGWEAQGDGFWYYGLHVENGRIADSATMQLKSALCEICRELESGIRLTANQSLLVTDIAGHDRPRLEAILRRHRVPLSEAISTVRRWSMACVAWPTCGLAITEAERALPGILDGLEAAAGRWGMSREAFTVRMTGCPNGCVRPYNADIGLAGKAKDRYTVLLGGTRLGTRLNFVYRDLVPADEIVSTLTPLFAYFQQECNGGESFGDFCHRKGAEDLRDWATRFQVGAA